MDRSHLGPDSVCQIQKSLLILILILATSVFLLSSPAWPKANKKAPYTSHVRLYKVEKDNDRPRTMAVLFITPKSNWYFYTAKAKDLGKPTRITVQDKLSQEDLPVYYPPGQKSLKSSGAIQTAYASKTPFFIPIPASRQKDKIKLSIHFESLLCSAKGCWPVEEEISFLKAGITGQEIPWLKNSPWSSYWPKSKQIVPKEPAEADSRTTTGAYSKTAKEKFQPRFLEPGHEVHGLGKAITLALLAGLILNVMPCVLPVLSLKLRSLVPSDENISAQGSRNKRYRQYNLMFSLGIISYFLILSVIFSLSDMVWGEIFQSPLAVSLLIAIVFALSLSLFGIYELPTIDVRHQSSGTYSTKMSAEAYTTGFLVTLLATPCSGPLLGGVLAWTLTQSAIIVGVVFAFMGLGMSLPYLSLALFPKLVRYFPRPGAWTSTVEQVIGFFLVGTCIYLFSLLPQEFYLRVFILLWLIGVGAWCWGRFTNLQQSGKKRWGLRSLIFVIAMVVASQVLNLDKKKNQVWVTYSAKKFEKYLGQTNILLEFTAPWCPNCKFLEKTVLQPAQLLTWREKYNFIPIRVDLSKKPQQGKSLLASLDSRSIPLVALFTKGENSHKPVLIRDMFTKHDLEQTMENLF